MQVQVKWNPFVKYCSLNNIKYLLSSLGSNLLVSSTTGKEHHGSTNPASKFLASVVVWSTFVQKHDKNQTFLLKACKIEQKLIKKTQI